MHSPLYDATSTVDLAPEAIDYNQVYLYTVRDGDTISDVSKMYGVSINTILWANDLSSRSSLKTGQVLVILPVNGVKYTIKSGDTVDSIAKKFKSHPKDVIKFNNLEESGGKLAVGDEIIIPDGEKTGVVYSGTKDTTNYSSANGLILGYFIRPVPNGKKSQNIHSKNAVDIAAPLGSPVKAVADGKVILSRVGGWGGGYGNYIILQHPNGMRTLYAHMQKVSVSTGDNVTQGDVVGTVGSTGNSSGPHLHIELHRPGGANPPNRFY